jgi:hypothetical protein
MVAWLFYWKEEGCSKSDRRKTTMKKKSVFLTILIMILAFSRVANALLMVIGTANYLGNNYNLIYDNDQSLVWLDYTRGYDTWQNQVDWGSGLNTGGVLTYNLNPGINVSWRGNWRLPIIDESVMNLDRAVGWEGPDQNGEYDYPFGYNMVNSEMGYLYYEILGNLGRVSIDGTEPQPGWGRKNTGPFSNLQAYAYWSGTEYSPDTHYAYIFNFYSGCQDDGDKPDPDTYAMAVRSAQVTAPIPEPCTIDIHPDTLNKKSKGKYITCYIELPDAYSVEDINIETIVLSINGSLIPATASPTEIGDYNDNGIPDVMVKFDRQLVQDACGTGAVEMIITCQTYDETNFEGSDTVLAIDKGQKHYSEDHGSVIY